MAAKSRRRQSDEERDGRRRADRERLQQATEQLLTSEGWQRWVRVRSRTGLARLSISNQLLVALACPDATFVAGFKAWLQLGYCVKKGERAIAIIAQASDIASDATAPTRYERTSRRRLSAAKSDGYGDSSAVCGVECSGRSAVRISCVMVASDAKPD